MSNALTGRNVGKTCRVHYKGTLTMVNNLILPTTVARHWNSFAAPVK